MAPAPSTLLATLLSAALAAGEVPAPAPAAARVPEAAVGAQAAVGAEAAAVARAFDGFAAEFGKKYVPEERTARRRDFEANFHFIQAENAKNNTFELGLNGFADLSDAEFAASYLGLVRPNGTVQWSGVADLGTMSASGASVPSAVDWRKRGALTEVKNQGGCGACWTFSAAGALSAAWQIQTGQLVSLSEQQLLDCTRGGGVQGCQGGSMNPAFQYAESADLCTAASYPYRAYRSGCQAQSCDVGIPRGAVVGYRNVRPHDEVALQEAVARQPVAVGIEAEGRAFRFYKNGIYTNNCGIQPNHAVLLVGYGTEPNGPFWLLKNSWGRSWGEGGYFKLQRQSHGAGQCGVMQMPSYPVVRRAEHRPSTSRAPPSTSRQAPAGGRQRYGRPPCRSDEILGRTLGGVLCVPRCDQAGNCPADAAPGVQAKPQCVLKERPWDSKRKYCALVCRSTGQCPSGAKCLGRWGSGICVFPGGGGSMASVESAATSAPAADLEADFPRRLAEGESSEVPGVFV